MFVALLFWYQFFCGFSGSAMIDQWYLIFFNLLFSSIPQLVTGILDKDLPADMLIAVPELYRSGPSMEVTMWLTYIILLWCGINYPQKKFDILLSIFCSLNFLSSYFSFCISCILTHKAYVRMMGPERLFPCIQSILISICA